MKKIFLFFGIILLISITGISAECKGCLNNNQCYNPGDILNNKYCSLSKTFLNQKSDNSSCQNNFECISGYCMDEICINERVLTNLGIDENTLNNTENYLKQGPCTATPGCLNKTSLLNAQNVSGICINAKCFQCNSNTPHWNSSACTLPPCHYNTPGCWNISRINEIDHYENISETCNSGFTCIKCARNYEWTGEYCRYYSGTSPSPIIWKTNATFTEDSLASGFTIKLKAKERIKLTFNGIDYFIGIVSLTSNSAVINVSSKPQQILMSTGDERKIDLDNNGENDINLILSSIYLSQATIFIKKLPSSPTTACTEGETKVRSCPGGGTINTQICQNNQFITTEEKCPTPREESSNSNNLIWVIIITCIIIAIVITLILIIYFLNNKPKSTLTRLNSPGYTPSRPSFSKPITRFPPNKRFPSNFPRRNYP